MLLKSLQAQSPFHKEQVIRRALIFEEEKLQAHDLDRKGGGGFSAHPFMSSRVFLKVSRP